VHAALLRVFSLRLKESQRYLHLWQWHRRIRLPASPPDFGQKANSLLRKAAARRRCGLNPLHIDKWAHSQNCARQFPARSTSGKMFPLDAPEQRHPTEDHHLGKLNIRSFQLAFDYGSRTLSAVTAPLQHWGAGLRDCGASPARI
jgi:hypothetical protein